MTESVGDVLGFDVIPSISDGIEVSKDGAGWLGLVSAKVQREAT